MSSAKIFLKIPLKSFRFLGSTVLVLAIGKESLSSVPLAVASVILEQNATDGDMEVVFKVKGGDNGS